MDEIDLVIPEAIIDLLPEGSEDTERDMKKAVAGWQDDLNAAIDDNGDAVSVVVDFIEYFEQRWEAYDEFIVELRAWGQSPIYAMAWRDLHAAIIRQLYDHDNLGERIDRERNVRIVEGGIRPG